MQSLLAAEPIDHAQNGATFPFQMPRICSWKKLTLTQARKGLKRSKDHPWKQEEDWRAHPLRSPDKMTAIIPRWPKKQQRITNTTNLTSQQHQHTISLPQLPTQMAGTHQIPPDLPICLLYPVVTPTKHLTARSKHNTTSINYKGLPSQTKCLENAPLRWTTWR